MHDKFDVCGHDGQVSVQICGYENTKAENDNDANWLGCFLQVRVGPITGSLNMSVTTRDLASFLDQVTSAFNELRGAAKFRTLEDSLRLDLQMEKDGRMHVTGTVEYTGQVHVMLSFSFDSDQSFLGQTLQQLRAVVEHFPILEADNK